MRKITLENLLTSRVVSKAFLITFFGFWPSCIHFSSIQYKNYHNSTKQSKSVLNKTIKDLSFFPINGYRFRLSELKNIKAIVIVMRDRNCPTSDEHGSSLIRLEKKYSPLGVQFIYSYVGQKNSLQNGKKDLKQFNFSSPYIIDTNQKVVSTMAANVVENIFVLTPERRVIYTGPFLSTSKKYFPEKRDFISDILDTIVLGKKFAPKEIIASGCAISYPVIQKKLFFENVAPIISKKCSICHNPLSQGPINYLTYKDVAGRRNMFRHVIENDLMPPWNIDPTTGPWKNDLSLTSLEKAMLLKWLSDDCPKRSGKTVRLWNRKKQSIATSSSYTIRLPEKIKIPTEGLNSYKRYIIQTSFEEEKWIKNVEFFLKPKIIHHMFLFILDNSFSNAANVNPYDHITTAFGTSGGGDLKGKINESQNVGYKLPKQAKLFLVIHYESIGQAVTDDYTHIRIAFHKKKPVHKRIAYILHTRKITIPPHESDYKIKLSYKLKTDMLLSAIRMHMHLRGKASSMFVTSPENIRKRIFGIDPYLQKFQTLYELKTPLKVVKGSMLECITWFDNSEKNPVNPDPTKYVTWGPFLKDEMNACRFSFLVPIDVNLDSQLIYIDPS